MYKYFPTLASTLLYLTRLFPEAPKLWKIRYMTVQKKLSRTIMFVSSRPLEPDILVEYASPLKLEYEFLRTLSSTLRPHRTRLSSRVQKTWRWKIHDCPKTHLQWRHVLLCFLLLRKHSERRSNVRLAVSTLHKKSIRERQCLRDALDPPNAVYKSLD
jgi:hypothetical protein